MSSILDALKRADQESAVDSGRGTPWPAPSMDAVSDGRHRRRWWIPLGAVTLLCAVASVFWLIRGPVSDQQPVIANQVVEPVTTGKTLPATPNAEKTPFTIQGIPAAAPAVPQSTFQPPKKPSTLPSVAPAPDSELTTTSPTRGQQESIETKPQPAEPPPADEIRTPAQTAETPRVSEKTKTDSKNVFRTDDRVELQALVWSPEAADRFVVINNRLIKEGGSIDNITVVKINPDDVLLSEGTDRWHQAFKIR